MREESQRLSAGNSIWCCACSSSDGILRRFKFHPSPITSIPLYNSFCDAELTAQDNGRKGMKVREVKTKNDSVTVKFRYDATGNRKEKRVEKFDTVMITRYMRDASGNVMSIYTDTTVLETPIYGSARLGMYQGQIIEGSQTLGRRSYELSNHLGNVLATITDHINMNADSAWANVTARVITIRSGWRWEDVEKYNFVGFDAGFSRIIKIPTRTKLQKGRNPNGIENGMD